MSQRFSKNLMYLTLIGGILFLWYDTFYVKFRVGELIGLIISLIGLSIVILSAIKNFLKKQKSQR